MARLSQSRDAGFTLIEVLIAFAILATGILTMAAVQVEGMKGGQKGRHLARATIVAESQMEQLQGSTWPSIPPTGWTAPLAIETQVQSTMLQTEQLYWLTWRITDVAVGSTRALDVQVNWTEDNQARRVTLSSVRYNHEALP